MKSIHVVLLVVISAWPLSAIAHGDSKQSNKPRAISTEEKSFGREGDPKKISRTIDVDMSDKMRYSPSELTIRPGETVRFRIKNSGQVLHEMVLGSMKELKEHAEVMRKHPGMEHEEPYMAHVAAGKEGTMVWQFTKPGEFFYGCLVPGHFEAGMVGKIIVTKGSGK